VNDALRQEKLQYLQAKVVYEELNDILLDYEISRLDQEADSPSVQVKSSLLSQSRPSLNSRKENITL
jgi:hypothetical protein